MKVDTAISFLEKRKLMCTQKYVHEVCLGAYVNSLYRVPMLIVFISNVLIPVATTAFLWFKVLV